MALWGSLQVKFGLSYIAVIAAVLLLLNTYPLPGRPIRQSHQQQKMFWMPSSAARILRKLWII